jgi:predicted cupin superfamily sugar epimerase
MNLEELKLTPHPEGGRFRELYRSPDTVTLTDGRARAAMTHIYFHLAAGEVSRFHRVEQDEVWNLYSGSVRLHMFSGNGEYTQITLSEAVNTFCAVIPATTWQAAEPLDGDCLAGCTVAPGFDFADFQMITADHSLCPVIRGRGLERFLVD